jgi:NADH-quinone oxidoreductase subunit M
LNGFISEFLVVRGAWPIFTLFTALSMIGLCFTGAYILKGDQAGAARPAQRALGWAYREINAREVLVIAPLMVLMLWIGVWPAWILNVINEP